MIPVGNISLSFWGSLSLTSGVNEMRSIGPYRHLTVKERSTLKYNMNSLFSKSTNFKVLKVVGCTLFLVIWTSLPEPLIQL